MKRLILIIFAVYALALSACAGCNNDDVVVPPPDEAACPAKNEPVIVRTELDPKEGKAPLTVRFNVQGEDDDEDFCDDEQLLYHFDFDGDGFEDGKPRKSGKNVDHTYDKPGDFRVTIWLTDAAEQASKKTNKFIKVGDNKPPRISDFTVLPSQGQRPLITQISWGWLDDDGYIDRFELDFGDGTIISQSKDDSPTGALPSSIDHAYYALGTHVLKLRIYDDVGAMAQAERSVTVFAQALPSSFVQTMGLSLGLAVNDNGGAHFADDRGAFDLGLVADGYLGLKVVRYPLSAFSVTAASGATAELVGIADPSPDRGFARDVATYANMAVVVGESGMYVYNIFGAGAQCVNPWDTNCFPGTPTAPASYCGYDGSPQILGSTHFAKVALISPTGAFGETWAIANGQPGQANGGIHALMLSGAATVGGFYHNAQFSGTYDSYTPATGKLTGAVFTSNAGQLAAGDVVRTSGGATSVIRSVNYDSSLAQYYVVIGENAPGFATSNGSFDVYRTRKMQGDCWGHSGLQPPFSGFQNALNQRSYDLKVAGDYAYIGVEGPGIVAVDMGSALINRTACGGDYAACFEAAVKWRLSDTPGWLNMQHAAYGIELTESRPVNENMPPATFLDRADVSFDAGGKFRDCDENRYAELYPNWVSAVGAVTNSATHALLKTERRIYPGNRVAIATASGVLTNGGLGYRVTANVGESIVIEGDFTAAAPATWSTVKLYGALTYARLPSYPGVNPVAFSGAQADSVGQNAVCRNFVNAYAAITTDVSVSFMTAPLLVAAIDGSAWKGIAAFDRSNPEHPEQLTPNGSFPYLIGLDTYFVSHEDNLFISRGTGSPITVLDLSDPIHLADAAARRETFGLTSGAYAANEMVYRITENNPEGVLLIATGDMGLGAYYVADYLAQGPGVLTANCNNKPTCNDWVDGLQLRHEGIINDIKLVGNDYALVAQNNGGVLVYDVSGAVTGADPVFVSHIRTKDNPIAMRVVDDGAGNDIVYIADNSSLYRIPFSDPTRPGTHVGSLMVSKVPARFGYNCVDGSVGKIFGCAAVYRNNQTGEEFEYAQPLNPSVVPTGKLFFNEGMSLPAYEIVNKAYDGTGCNQALPDSGTTRIWTDMLDGRLFLFGESMYGVMMREITLTAPGGAVALTDAGGGRMVANACQWYQRNFADMFASYQNRPGVWKRLYTSNEYTNINFWDIGALEAKLGDSSYSLAQQWPKLASLDLAPIAGSYATINRLMAVGPYLFVSAGDSGAYVIDATDGYNPKVIGSSRIAAPGTKAAALNVVAYPDGLGGTYTYMTLISDNKQGGGIRLVRFPALAAP